MKSIIVIAFALAVSNAHAQNAAIPLAKPLSDETTPKPVKKSTAAEIKLSPPAVPLQKLQPAPQTLVLTEQPKVNPPAPEFKGVAVGPETQKGMAPKNIDRPKGSTLEPLKKVEPVTMPAPKIVKPEE